MAKKNKNRKNQQSRAKPPSKPSDDANAEGASVPSQAVEMNTDEQVSLQQTTEAPKGGDDSDGISDSEQFHDTAEELQSDFVVVTPSTPIREHAEHESELKEPSDEPEEVTEGSKTDAELKEQPSDEPGEATEDAENTENSVPVEPVEPVESVPESGDQSALTDPSEPTESEPAQSAEAVPVVRAQEITVSDETAVKSVEEPVGEPAEEAVEPVNVDTSDMVGGTGEMEIGKDANNDGEEHLSSTVETNASNSGVDEVNNIQNGQSSVRHSPQMEGSGNDATPDIVSVETTDNSEEKAPMSPPSGDSAAEVGPPMRSANEKVSRLVSSFENKMKEEEDKAPVPSVARAELRTFSRSRARNIGPVINGGASGRDSAASSRSKRDSVSSSHSSKRDSVASSTRSRPQSIIVLDRNDNDAGGPLDSNYDEPDTPKRRGVGINDQFFSSKPRIATPTDANSKRVIQGGHLRKLSLSSTGDFMNEEAQQQHNQQQQQVQAHPVQLSRSSSRSSKRQSQLRELMLSSNLEKKEDRTLASRLKELAHVGGSPSGGGIAAAHAALVGSSSSPPPPEGEQANANRSSIGNLLKDNRRSSGSTVGSDPATTGTAASSGDGDDTLGKRSSDETSLEMNEGFEGIESKQVVDQQDSSTGRPLLTRSQTQTSSDGSFVDQLKESIRNDRHSYGSYGSSETQTNTEEDKNVAVPVDAGAGSEDDTSASQSNDQSSGRRMPSFSLRPIELEDVPEEDEEENVIFGVCVVGFHHARGPEVEYWIGADGDKSTVWPNLPFQSLPDGSHSHEENFCYFTLLFDDKTGTAPVPISVSGEGNEKQTPDMKNATTLFGISCNRQLRVSEIKHVTSDITRSTVQKSVVVVARKPIFGPIKEKLAVVTRAYFSQGDFEDRKIIDNLYENLTQIFTHKLDEAELNVGMPLRELIMRLGQKVLVVLKAMLLEKKVLFFASNTELLCASQFSLVSLIPNLISNLDDCGSPLLHRYESKLRKPTSLRTSDRSSLLAFMGLPLQIFAEGGMFSPYVPLQQLDQLKSEEMKYFLVGSTNSLVIAPEAQIGQVVVNMDDESVTIVDPSLKSLLNLTSADKKWMDVVVRSVTDTWDPEDPLRPKGLGFLGSEDYIRIQFEDYIVNLLSSVKYDNFLKRKASLPRNAMLDRNIKGNPIGLYNNEWVEAWRTTNNYRMFNKFTDEELFDIVDPKHMATSPTSIDIQRQLIDPKAHQEEPAVPRESLAKSVSKVFSSFWGEKRPSVTSPSPPPPAGASSSASSVKSPSQSLKGHSPRQESQDRMSLAESIRSLASNDSTTTSGTLNAESKEGGTAAGGGYFSGWTKWAAGRRKNLTSKSTTSLPEPVPEKDDDTRSVKSVNLDD
uniref:ARAD1D21252p n=1 Tax=Blastobotrys adeninivorans TaxID=409370 RepID=A0A060TAP0_BLAAD